ncbi:MAG: hypothetical protein JXB32_05640 [Deltaproteobacteria bacterium]|nr:hypothetical protein [Deltaproteobacteria bacterium]
MRGRSAWVVLVCAAVAGGCPARRDGGGGAVGPTPYVGPAPVPNPVGPPPAGDPDAARRIELLLAGADETYRRDLDVMAVVGTVEEAVALARQHGVTGTLGARACAMRGVIHVWLGETAPAVEMLALALSFDPELVVPSSWGGPEVEEALAKARRHAPPPPPPPPEAGPPTRHRPILAQTPDHPIPIWVELRPDLAAATDAVGVLYWRSSRAPEGGSVPMTRLPAGFYVELPCVEPAPEWWEYFIVLTGAGGGVLTSIGSADLPYRVTITPRLPGPAPTYPDGSPIPECGGP